jgi:hypothetical protein
LAVSIQRFTKHVLTFYDLDPEKALNLRIMELEFLKLTKKLA